MKLTAIALLPFIAFVIGGTVACGSAEAPAPSPTPTGGSPSAPEGSGADEPGPANSGPADTGPTSSKKKFGAQCKSSAECASDFCVFRTGGSTLGMCSKTCAVDFDCPGFDNKCVALSDAPQKVCIPK